MDEIVQLPNPVIKADENFDAEDLKFLEAARLADVGADIPADLVKSEPATKAPEPVKTEPEIEKPKLDGERARDPATGKFIKTDAEIAAENGQPEAVDASKTAPESDYARLQREKREKETARLDKTWENVNARKEILDAKEREIAQLEQRLRQPQRPQLQVPTMEDGTPITSKALFSARQDYKQRAREALTQGDYDTHREQDNLADEAEKAGIRVQQIEQQMATETQQRQWNDTWKGGMQKAIEATPDLSNPETELSKHVTQILETHGNELWLFKDGFQRAVEIAQLRIDAADAPTLREQIKAKDKEIERLNGLTSIGGSGPTAPPSKKTFDQMSEGEQDDFLMRQANKADNL